ncbi:MAG: efflux RND transporter periplasmic adaptor subunit [Acidobacteria bacterium]|nr:efflux RND transporter periplasmic adaptor subunit [Acidobacteriota bacterium]MCA1639759.1 efflux RND transporter periplasmic adaptor subunit [Acidobacteriota bacterium]
MKAIKFISFAILITIFSLGIAACSGSKAETDVSVNVNSAQPQIVDVTTATAIVQNMPTYFEATGSLASDSQTDVAPTVGGKITAVNFDLGSYVQKGDVLVQLDDRDARIRLQQAEAQVNQAKSNVQQAQAQVEAARANVRQTQSRLGLTQGSNFNIETFTQVRSTQAQLDLAEKELGRFERLLETGDVSRSSYDQRKAQRDQLRAQLDEARSTAAVAVSAIRTAQAQVETAQAAVRTAQSAADAAQTQIATAQKAISDATVYAPLSGYIAERIADVGEFASTSSKIATILRTSVLRLRIDIPEQSIGQIAAGQGVSIQTSAYPDRKFSGVVTRISPNLNATSRTLTVEAEVENVGGLLKPGQFATVRITQSTPAPTVMIPTSAVKTEGETNKVFVIKEGRAQERTVKLGLLENDLIEVKQGVLENEVIATRNLEQIYDGVAVRQ